ncbi:MAG TPA: CapA family protein [Candidatus Pristimantibacillus sp.]|nr:CapA family protein [Candidatus Pristimantibacillus sp.]
MRWQSGRQRKRSWGRPVTIIVVAAVGLALLATGSVFAYHHFKKPAKPAVVAKTVELAKNTTPPYTSVVGRYMFSGTIVLDRVVVSAAKGDTNQPFSQMDTFGTFDAGIADLECPVTSDPNLFMINVDNPHFNCRPDWLPALKKYFPIVKLSGNHTFDKGAAGFDTTVKNLQDAGIQAVGSYNPHTNPKNNCEVVAMPVRLEKTDGTEDKGTLPIAFCAFNYKTLFPDPAPGELELISQYSEVMPVFGFLQDGVEYQTTAAQSTADLAHKFIDNGAQFVIANGAHYVQNSEAYKGKPIVFSTGNFIFDQVDDESRRSVSIAIDMSVKYDDNVAKWLQLSKTCDTTARFDNCLAAAQNQGLTNFDVKLTYKPLAAVGGAHAVTHLSSPAAQQSILDRLNWTATCSGLTGNVCAQ